MIISISELQCVPLQWFVSTEGVQGDRWIVYIVSQSADPNLVRGTAGSYILKKQKIRGGEFVSKKK